MSTPKSDHDVRVAELLDEARSELHAGKIIDLPSWQARYPDLSRRDLELVTILRSLESAVEDWQSAATVDAPAQGLVDTQSEVTAEALPRCIGRYQILDQLGEGGMGTVYKAHDPQLQRTVAVKVPRFHGSRRDQAVRIKRFEREARAAAAVRHPHVCPIHDVGEHGSIPYVVMACLEGETLADLLRRQRRFDDIKEAVALVRQVAEALTAVHAHGIIHRDLKPGNIMLDSAGRAILMDFGLAMPEQEGERLTLEGTVLGTPAYMSPEQAIYQPEKIGPASDVYSLGVVLYQMLTGRLPFEGPGLTMLYKIAHETPPPPSQFRQDLSPALDAVMMKALARRPEDRFTTAQEFAAALGAAVESKWLAGQVPKRKAAASQVKAGRTWLMNCCVVATSLCVLALGILIAAKVSKQAQPRREAIVPTEVVTFPQDHLFSLAKTYPAASEATGVAAGDFNGDGRPDLAIASKPNSTVLVLLRRADGNFDRAGSFSTCPMPITVATGDLNGDGKLDLVVGGTNDEGLSVLLGNGDGTFQQAVLYPAGTWPSFFALRDVDADGKLDIVAITSVPEDAKVNILRGEGDGTFEAAVPYPVGGYPSVPAIADFDGDGKLDLAVNNAAPGFQSLSILRGNGDGTFQPAFLHTEGMEKRPFAVATGDVNGDGKPDLVVSFLQATGWSSVRVLLGNGDCTFKTLGENTVGLLPRTLVLCDFDGDGKLDLATGNSGSDTICLLLGKGDGTFQATQSYTVAAAAYEIAVADFNGDGQPDLAATLWHGNKVAILLNGTKLQPREQ